MMIMRSTVVVALTATVLLLLAGPARAVTLLQCNKSLASGSTLRLTGKLDLSGKYPDPVNNPWPCAVVGPAEGPPATIVMPDDDCMLLSQGEVTLSGNLRFIVGKKSQAFDCCRDGESHGSILCSYDGLTVAKDAHVVVETMSPDVVISPGGFWTADSITVEGALNATLQTGQMTGINGLLSAGNAVHISSTGSVVVSGTAVARGAAIQGGDGGTIIEGFVSCTRYTSGDAGGCVAGGNNLTITAGARIHASDVVGQVAGCVANGGKLLQLAGSVVVRNITCQDAGAVFTSDNAIMSGNSSIDANGVYAAGGSSIIATTNFTMRDSSRVTGKNSWGGDGGLIGVTNAVLKHNALLECENSYADHCGACLLANIVLTDNVTIRAKNVSAKAVGGAICGAYPGQNISVHGGVTVSVEGSHVGLYGGAMLAHHISLDGGPFDIKLQNVTAPCAGAVATRGPRFQLGEGNFIVDGSAGGKLRVVDAVEGNASLGCLNIEANLMDPSGTRIPQPCSGCGGRSECQCGHQAPAAVLECCT